MNISILFIRLGGVINLLIAVLHLFFWQLFSWQTELAKLSVDNSNIMQMLNLFSIVFLLYSAALLIFRPFEFLSSTVGRAFLGMFSTLYLARLAMEFYFPAGSLIFATILLVTVMLFAIPLFQTTNPIKATSHANQ